MAQLAALVLGLWFVFAPQAHGEWEPDQRLTNDSNSSLLSRNSERCIACGPGSLVHVCWWDDRNGNCEIYYKRSTDNGLSWSADLRLTDDTARSWTPSIAVADSTVHLTWFDTRDGPNGEVYYRRSTDAGSTWLPASRMSFDTAKSEVPSMAASGKAVHLVWRDSRDARFSWEIYYRSSTDAGQTWSPETRLTAAAGIKWNPSVAATDSLVHVVWADNRDGNWEVYYKRSTDYGATWQADERLTESIFAQQWPCVVASGAVVVVAWTDGEDIDGELYCRHSEDGGTTWFPQSRITHGSAQPGMWAPTLALSGERVHAVWPDGRDGNFEVYYCRSTDLGTTWEPELRLVHQQAVSNYPCVAVGDSTVHVAWSDYRDGVFPEIYYKRDPIGNVALAGGPITQPLHPELSSNFVRYCLQTAKRDALATSSSLLNAAGQRVLTLHPGANDLHGLAPGIYFGAEALPASHGKGQRRKVIIQN